MATDMTLFENAVDQVIIDSERLHNVVNGSAVEEVITEDGSTIPTIRKAMLDNIYFKTPPLPWSAGAVCKGCDCQARACGLSHQQCPATDEGHKRVQL